MSWGRGVSVKYADKVHFKLEKSFGETINAINKNEPTKGFAQSYLAFAKQFVKEAFVLRQNNDEQAKYLGICRD